MVGLPPDNFDVNPPRANARGNRLLRINRVLIPGGLVLLLGYLALCAGMFFFQRNLLYFPRARTLTGPEVTLKLQVPGAELVITKRDANSPNAILYFGGNGEDVSANLPLFSAAFPNHAIYLTHYRGYGGSSGSPSEEFIQQDALALFDQVVTKHDKVAVIGRSLGSGVAIQVASQRPASALILVTPFFSILEIAARRFPFLPVGALLIDKFESWKYAEAISMPTLLIAAEWDEVIPKSSTDRLFERFERGIATLEVIPGTNHNNISSNPRYLPMIQSMLGMK
ncbi:MAG: alpha/beta fold hydrolase [Gemmataceae bacterium]|nr:alpha/beta fold hydrolase [Gemmataceae bacterium]